MNKTIWVLKILILSVSSQKLGGTFYVVNEGFFPRTFENDYISFVSELKSMKNDWEDKRIHAWFYLKRRIKNLGFSVQSFKESGKMWLPRGPPITFPNLCHLTGFHGKNFMKCFSGMPTLDPCSLDARNYTVTNYNLEPDLKDALGQSLFYGHFKYSVTVSGIMNEKSTERDKINFDMVVWIYELDHKQAKGKSGFGKNKNPQMKTHQNRKKTG